MGYGKGKWMDDRCMEALPKKERSNTVAHDRGVLSARCASQCLHKRAASLALAIEGEHFNQ
jgi:hypothetical protein